MRKVNLGVFFLMVVLAAVSVTEAAGPGGNSGSKAIVGSWKVRLTSDDPNTPPFNELITFAEGGGIVESNTFPFYLQGLVASPGHGSWSYGGSQRYYFTFFKYLAVPNGPTVGTLKAAGSIDYVSWTDTWSGPANVSMCDVEGNNCVPIGVTHGAAKRIIAGL